MALCDHVSVGVIIEGSSHPAYAGEDGTYLLFQRVKPPYGIAPVAGHQDDFESVQLAMRLEAEQETALYINGIYAMVIDGEWRDNACRRDHSGPAGHRWWVGRTTAHGQHWENPEETKDLRWYDVDQINALAWRTHQHAVGLVDHRDFYHRPGLEPVWVEWLIRAGLVRSDGLDLDAIARLAERAPASIDEETRP